MSRKILIVSPTPTHPANAGNRVHLLELSGLLRKNGFDVHFLHLAFEEFDENEILRYWGNHLYTINRVQLFEKGPLLQYYFNRILQEVRRLKRKIQQNTGYIDKLQLKYNSEIDDHFPRTIKENIKSLQREHQFEIVICEYVFLSKVLTFFDRKVLRILDTQDRFTDRFSVYLKNGLKPEWFSFYADQERKAFNRADIIIAVQDKERLYFSNLTKRPVIRYCTVYDQKDLPPRSFEKKLLYFASNNQINHLTLKNFEEEILPLIENEHPGVQLLIGGSICKNYQPIRNKTRLMGIYDDASDFYSSGDIVINPEFHGTGYKIKTMEALSFGLPMVCTEVGAAGLTDPFVGQFLLAKNHEDFAECVNELLAKEELRKDTASKAHEWIKELKENVTSNLLNFLTT